MWVTLDPETHRIVRPSAFPEAEQYLHTSRGELFAPLPKLSCDNVRLHHVHEVRYSDLDVNNHVNNVRAVELISDALDLYKQPGFVSELQVNYTAETACGESLSLLTGTADSARYIRGEADGRTASRRLPRFRRCPTRRRDWYDASDRAAVCDIWARASRSKSSCMQKSVRCNRQAQAFSLCVIVPESANCRTLRTHLHLAITVSVPVSLSVYTTEEWAELCTDSTSYAAWIARKGKVIYDQTA